MLGAGLLANVRTRTDTERGRTEKRFPNDDDDDDDSGRLTDRRRSTACVVSGP